MSQPIDPVPVTGQNRTFLIVCLCFLLSGFAALLYETVWLRQFAIILGTSEQALAVILGAYMGGLSFGAWVASRTTGLIRRPLLTYGILEAGIAACALAMPFGLTLVQWLQVKFFGSVAEPPPAGSLPVVMFGLVSAFALILPPTAMMGATLPLLAKFVVRNDRELGPRIGFLYAINTLGAVAGTLTAAFVCLPALGLGRTTWVGAAINFAVFALIWLGLTEEPSEIDVDLVAEPSVCFRRHCGTGKRLAGKPSRQSAGCLRKYLVVRGNFGLGFVLLRDRIYAHAWPQPWRQHLRVRDHAGRFFARHRARWWYRRPLRDRPRACSYSVRLRTGADRNFCARRVLADRFDVGMVIAGARRQSFDVVASRLSRSRFCCPRRPSSARRFHSRFECLQKTNTMRLVDRRRSTFGIPSARSLARC